MRSLFEDFLLAQTFPNAFDAQAKPRRWKQAMITLSGAVLQIQLKGAMGASSLTKWK